MPSALRPAEWWGTFTIPRGTAGRFHIGPLVVSVTRLSHEWLVCRERPEGKGDEDVRVELPVPAAPPPVGARVTRYATASETESFRILPVLPDRTVVTRPERPLTILPHTQVTLYVGSPVWVRLLQGEGEGEPLGDLPVSRAKEAWSGPSTREGELCYATRTAGRLSLDEVALRPHRVMTSVSIRNGASTPFVCDRVNLPVRRLSVYTSDEGRLWTESVALEHTADAELARLDVHRTPPKEASHAALVSGPRDTVDGGLFRAFGNLFG